MEKYVKIICVIVIVFAIIMGIVLCAAVSLMYVQSEKLKEREAEREALEEALAAPLEQKPTTTRPTVPELPESPDLSLVEPGGFGFSGQVYQIIIEQNRDEAVPCALCVGNVITPEGVQELKGDLRYVYSDNTDVVAVSKDCTINAIAPGEANVVIGDGDTYLVFACVVQE